MIDRNVEFIDEVSSRISRFLPMNVKIPALPGKFPTFLNDSCSSPAVIGKEIVDFSRE